MFWFSVDQQKLWCSVDRSLRFYESELATDPCMQINLKDIVCLGVSRADPSSSNGFPDRWVCSLGTCVLLDFLCPSSSAQPPQVPLLL